MEGSARYKVPGGKLVSIKLEYDTSIKKVMILGDFFIYPESALGEIEECLVATGVEKGETEIANKINYVVTSCGIQLIGVTPDAIAKAIKMAVK